MRTGVLPSLFGVLGLCYNVFASADQNIFTAESGQKNVTLTCRVPNKDKITALEWSRADLGDEYVLLYRNGHFDPENQHPSFKNRVDLQDRQMKDGDVSVILKDVRINDTGTYECQVAQGDKQPMKLISIIYLHVDPPAHTGGDTEDGGKEDGGKKDGGKEAGGKEDGSGGLIVGLSVSALLLVVVVVGVLIYSKHHQQQNKDSYQPPAEQLPA